MPSKEDIKKDIEKYSSLDSLKDIEGGKILIETLEKDCLSCINEITFKCRELSHIELLALCIRLNEKLNVLKVIKNAEKNAEMAKEEFDKIMAG